MNIPLFNIHDLVLVLTLAVCLQLVIFQWLLSKQKPIASLLLSGFFISVGINALCTLLLWNDYIGLSTQDAKMALSLVMVTAVLGKGMFLYLYVTAITREHFRWRPGHALHLVVLAPALGLVLGAGLDSDRLRFIGHHTERSTELATWLWHYLKGVPVLYALAAVLAIRRYQQQLTEFYSAFSPTGPLWLLLLTLGFALNWLWSLVVHLLGPAINPATAGNFGIVDMYLTCLLVNALFAYSLLYAHALLATRDKPATRETDRADALSAQSVDYIRSAMEERQLYLIQNLNIEEFARQVGIHYREVSSIINRHFNTNFFEFVNAYRIEKAKALLRDPDRAQMTIMDILLECGFNSKSSFNRFFKRYTGMSAAEFRKHPAAADKPDEKPPVKPADAG